MDVIKTSKMYQLTLFLSIIAIGLASDVTPVKKCKNFDVGFKQVVIKNQTHTCTELPCYFKSGTNFTMDVDFIAKSDIHILIMKMNATMKDLLFEYPIPNADKGCDLIRNNFCPVVKDKEISLRYFSTVKEDFTCTTSIALYSVNQNNEPMFCFELPVKIFK